MAAAEVKKVLQLKHQLKESSEGHTLLKVLKKLEVLDITLEILAETGIGKVVNSFRKHDEAGKVAKILVNRWKTLVPKDSLSLSEGKPEFQTQNENGEEKESTKKENNQISESTNSRKKPKTENSSAETKLSQDVDKCKIKSSKYFLNGEKREPKKDSNLNEGSWTREKKSAEHTKDERKKTDLSKKLKSVKLDKSLKGPAGTGNKSGDAAKKEKMKAKDKPAALEADREVEDICETPSMSFEAYLSYDLEPPKRKKCFSVTKNPKRLKTAHKENSSVSLVKMSKAVAEEPISTELQKQVPEQTVMDLLNIPLPTSFPECEDVSQYQYFSEKKADRRMTEECDEEPLFIGQRLKNKMQVYSGSKMTYLPSMMSLYQQCIRALQNNIDSLYEIGGVPFEILEPVLERCTAEQLLRIEELNPVYIGATDHLWERHCQKDFRNAQLDEYESWREMYLRMFEERERKLQQLTKSIVSAHSGKPKGRQVKMAFIHSAAKPPRNVRIQQEIHGTAGPIAVPHPIDRASSVKPSDNRGRSGFSEPSKPCSSNQSQDPRKIKRVAPMMAKSLKAFRKRFSRR